MGTMGDGTSWRVNSKLLRKHLLSIGLIEGSSKWGEVWFRKCYTPRFGSYK